MMKSIIKGRFSQWLIIFLAVGLLLQPVQQVMAAESSEVVQETLATSGPTAPESKKAEPINSEVEVNSEEKTEELEETKEEESIEGVGSEEETSGPEGGEVPPVVPVVQLPPSTVKQKLPDADVASGALVYNHQIGAPSGRAGMQPDIALSYNSQQNEEGSIVGHGWGLDIPTIERKNVNGLNKMYDSDDFTSSLDGDLKKTWSTRDADSFGAKIDNGSYLQYNFEHADGGVWTVQDKNGIIFTFGSIEDARLSNPVDATKVFRWYLSKIQDAKGNFVTYEYTKVDHQVYPSVIKYSGFGSDPGILKMEFVLEDRPDKAMSAKYGFMVTNTKRISEIKTFVQTTLVGKYDLSYSQQSVNGRSQLTGVEYTGFDVNGVNGISDGGMAFGYESIAATDLLTKITQNTGGVTEVTYKSSPQYRDGSGAALNPRLPFALQTVEKIEYDDRNGIEWENSFEYAGGWFYYNGPMDRRFVGFEKVVRTDDVGNTLTTFYHQGNDSNAVYGELEDDWAKTGKPYKSELRDESGNLVAQTLNKWEFDRLAGSEGVDERSFVRVSATVSRTFDGDTSHKDKAVTYVYDEDTGNLTSAVDWGQVNASDSGTFTDVGNDKVTINVSYATPTIGNFMTGFASGYISLNQSGVKVNEVKNYYDGLTFGQVSIGNETKKENWVAGSTYSAVSRTYNSFGLPITETDPRNNTTTFAYDTFNLYPITVTNALSQVVSYEYDYRIGKPFKTVDPNGLVSKVTFDGLGRAIKEEYTRPDQTDPNVLFTKKTASFELYEQGKEVSGWKTTEINYLDDYSTTTPRENKVVTYTDGFDRPIQVRAMVESADGSSDSRYSVSDTRYNGIAQIEKTSLPYFSVGDARTSITTDANLFATLTYDAAYRVTSTVNILGTSSNDFDDWKVTVTGPNGKIKVLYKDAKDQLVQVDEHNGSAVYETKYDYDAVGNLIKITDALDNEREFSYDGLGRRTQAEDLHAPSDTTFGVWNYDYDLAGNLVERTDAKGEIIEYSYDELNRLETESSKKSTLRTYEYDTCTKGIGRLCSVSSDFAVEEKEYDVLGQLIEETKTIGAEVFITSYTYDRQGNQVTIVNPDLSEVKYEYNIGNQQEKVLRKESVGSFVDVIVDMDYAPTGSMTYLEYASGAKTTNTYDAAKLYRLANKTTILPLQAGGTKTVQNVSYTYDAVGNIVYTSDISEISTRKNITYIYDDLHRLIWVNTAHATSGQNYSQTYQYDAIGNITFKSDTGTYSYDGDEGSSYANPHAVTSITLSGNTIDYEYDENGNMTTVGVGSSGNVTYEWDVYNRLIALNQSGISTETFSYEYDSNNTRIKSVLPGGETTLFPTGFYNTDGLVAQKHILAGGMNVATIKGSGSGAELTQLHSDHLGSVVVTSIPGTSPLNGGIAEILDYYPFGEVRWNSVPQGETEQRKYIGKEYDVETGLSYLEARYYDGHLGRFLSQDAVHLSFGDPNAIKQITGQELHIFLSDPQSFNSYSYARNNPLILRDAEGEFWRHIQSFASKFGYASSNYFQKQYQQTSWSSPFTKAGSYLLADAFKQQGVALDKNAPAKDRVVAGALLASNVNPPTKGAASLSYARYIAPEVSDKLANLQATRVLFHHGYDKHFVGQKEWGSLFENFGQAHEHVSNVIKNPSAYFNGGGKELFWDSRLGTMIIDNSAGAPTVLNPTRGYNYFMDQVRKLGGDTTKIKKK